MFLKILLVLFYFGQIYGQWIYYSVPQPQYYYPVIYYNSPSKDVCKNYRSDCKVFEYICDHPDYSWYMDCCCRDTCDPKCREKDVNDKDWESRRKRLKEQLGFDNKNVKGYDQKEDIIKKKSNNEVILSKYLGDIDKQNLQRNNQYNKLNDYSLWYDDDRWDRNNPKLPREKDRK
uniref:Uncharacterized protein n=1 Tax=Meloidogyne enterolobii TaxID=390850 RepID=A0A6V7U6P1_MELEN|nr:unnamed protein product [Meloidogyne enterolobii]